MLDRLAVFSRGVHTRGRRKRCVRVIPSTSTTCSSYWQTWWPGTSLSLTTPGPDTRYRLLETRYYRQYGEERLAEHEAPDARRHRHAEYFCALAALTSNALVGPGQVEAGQRFGAEHDNLLAATAPRN